MSQLVDLYSPAVISYRTSLSSYMMLSLAWLIPSWHVVLKSGKDRIFGVDTLGQYVPLPARYRTTC
jgi:hypothetical protein